MSFVKQIFVVLMVVMLSGCLNSMEDDLHPSGDDRRETAVAGSVGDQPGQTAPDFTLFDSLGNSFQLSDHLGGGTQPADAVVLYFTMWCPICLSHTDHLYNEIVPRFAGRGTVVYGLVDYVSATVANARAVELSSGYAGSAFTVLVDSQLDLFNSYNGAMGKVVVIASDGKVLLSEDYRNGSNLATTLDGILP